MNKPTQNAKETPCRSPKSMKKKMKNDMHVQVPAKCNGKRNTFFRK